MRCTGVTASMPSVGRSSAPGTARSSVARIPTASSASSKKSTSAGINPARIASEACIALSALDALRARDTTAVKTSARATQVKDAFMSKHGISIDRIILLAESFDADAIDDVSAVITAGITLPQFLCTCARKARSTPAALQAFLKRIGYLSVKFPPEVCVYSQFMRAVC